MIETTYSIKHIYLLRLNKFLTEQTYTKLIQIHTLDQSLGKSNILQ